MPETTFSIKGHNDNKIRIEPNSIRAEGGPEYPRLIILATFDLKPVRGNNSGEEVHFVILNTRCSLFLHDHRFKVADTTTNIGDRKINCATNMSRNIEFSFDHQRMKAIEAKRSNNAKVKLAFEFFLGLYEQNNLADFQSATAEIAFEIPKSHWVETILPALGLGQYFIVEIPYGQKVIQEAWDYLEKAEKSFWAWDSKSVYANCRELGTLLDKSIKEKLGINRFAVGLLWSKAYEKFNDLASLDLHLEDLRKSSRYSPEEIKISKADAEHLLLRSKCLIKYAEELMRN